MKPILNTAPLFAFLLQVVTSAAVFAQLEVVEPPESFFEKVSGSGTPGKCN